MHKGVVTTAGFIKMSADIYEVHKQYLKDRRDRYNPYTFITYCIKRHQAEVIPYTKKLKYEEYLFYA